MVQGVVQLPMASPALLKHLTRLASSPFTTSLTHTCFLMAWLWRHWGVMWSPCHLEMLLLSSSMQGGIKGSVRKELKYQCINISRSVFVAIPWWIWYIECNKIRVKLVIWGTSNKGWWVQQWVWVTCLFWLPSDVVLLGAKSNCHQNRFS